VPHEDMLVGLVVVGVAHDLLHQVPEEVDLSGVDGVWAGLLFE
jgi:hypothetical protein